MAIFLNTGRGTLAVAREVAFAATLLAPVVGTYRFMVGQEMDEQSLMQLNPALVYVLWICTTSTPSLPRQQTKL